MYTSYYAKNSDSPNAVSIAIYTPRWFSGRTYKKLAPTPSILETYKRTGDVQLYVDSYTRDVLSKLDVHEVWKELGPEAILLCYESPEKFCHRHIVAKWLRDAGYEIEEISYPY